MGTCAEPEITDAAIDAFARLLVLTGGPLRTHGRQDGGLICEDRTRRAHPRLWRISPEGELLPDSRYDHARRRFIATALPVAV